MIVENFILLLVDFLVSGPHQSEILSEKFNFTEFLTKMTNFFFLQLNSADLGWKRIPQSKSLLTIS